jgi:hypothetical protein
MKIIAFLFTAFISLQMSGQEKFPDGTPIPDWFRQNEIVNIDTLGKKYTITDYGVANDSTILQTEKIQAVIDRAAENGGGVIIIPKGTFLSGSIFFKPKTHSTKNISIRWTSMSKTKKLTGSICTWASNSSEEMKPTLRGILFPFYTCNGSRR